MKPCPRCNHEVQEDQTECPECGVVFAQWYAFHPSSPIPVSPTVPATGRFTPRHQKYLGLALVILGLVISIVSAKIEVPEIRFLVSEEPGIGWLVSGIGLALYAKGSGRSVVWGLLVLLPLVGYLIVLLGFARNKKIESPVSLPVPATGKFTTRHQKYLGLILVILSLVLFGLGAWVKVLTIAGVSWLLSGIGLALYAKGSGRSLVWGFLLGLYPPLLGPLIGLLVFARNKKLESKTGLSESALKWNVLLYAACMVLAALAAPRALWSQIILTENDVWSVLAQDGMGTMFGLMLALFVVVRLLLDIEKAIGSLGWRKASAWLVVRAVLAGLVIAIFWFGLGVNKDIEQKADSLIEQALGRIKPGMEREVVHELILEANAALLPKPHALFFTTAREEAAYDEMRNALKIGQAGGQVDLQKLHGIFFHTNKQSPFEKNPEHREVYETLDASIRPGTSEKDPGHREIFVRNCCAMVFAWTRYDLFIEYDPDDHLKSVRYLKSRHEDGRDRGCHVRLEIPASKDKQYPYPCPPDVQDF